MARKKSKGLERAVNTEQEMDALVREICLLTITHDEAAAAMDRELVAVRERHEARLAELRGQMDPLMDAAEDWALRNARLFATRKSIAMTHGTVGFRTGNWKLKPTKGMTWERVLEQLRQFMPEYVRTTHAPDKEKIIRDREFIEGELPRVGIEPVREEVFYVEPLRTDGAA